MAVRLPIIHPPTRVHILRNDPAPNNIKSVLTLPNLHVSPWIPEAGGAASGGGRNVSAGDPLLVAMVRRTRVPATRGVGGASDGSASSGGCGGSDTGDEGGKQSSGHDTRASKVERREGRCSHLPPLPQPAQRKAPEARNAQGLATAQIQILNKRNINLNGQEVKKEKKIHTIVVVSKPPSKPPRPRPRAAAPALETTPAPSPGPAPAPASNARPRRHAAPDKEPQVSGDQDDKTGASLPVAVVCPTAPTPAPRTATAHPGRRPTLSPRMRRAEVRRRACAQGLRSAHWETCVRAVRALAAGAAGAEGPLWAAALSRTAHLLRSQRRRVAMEACAAARDLLRSPHALAAPVTEEIVLQIFNHIAQVHFGTFTRALEVREEIIHFADVRKAIRLLTEISTRARGAGVRAALADCALLLVQARGREVAAGASAARRLGAMAQALAQDAHAQVRRRATLLLQALGLGLRDANTRNCTCLAAHRTDKNALKTAKKILH